MDGGGDGTSAKEANEGGGGEGFVVYMTLDIGVGVCLGLCLVACSVKKQDRVRIHEGCGTTLSCSQSMTGN